MTSLSHTPHSHPTSDLRGVLFALATFTFWVFADSSIKGLGKSALPAYEILAFMGLFVSAAIADVDEVS